MSSTIIKHSQRTVRKGCKDCGSTSLYWGHDTTVPGDRGMCDQCKTDGKWILLDADGETPHANTCPGRKGDAPKPSVSPKPAEKPATDTPQAPAASTPPAAPSGITGDAAAAFAALMAAMAPPQLDRAEIEMIIREEFGKVVFPTRTVVERQDGTVKPVEGKTHHRVADIITDVMAGEHVMMVGPAGTGKTTISEQVAEALGLAFYSISCNPMMPVSSIVGYMEATGNYVGTLFRQAFENGGVFLFDEIDNSHPSTLATINQALANGSMAFPDGMVKRHADFRVLAAANTYGRGADRKYVGRQAIDAATLDRFTIETIDIDEALEQDLAMATGLDADTVHLVLSTVRHYRANAERKKMSVVLSPRATIGMCRLLAAGRSWDDALEARVRRGLSDQDWAKLTVDAN